MGQAQHTTQPISALWTLSLFSNTGLFTSAGERSAWRKPLHNTNRTHSCFPLPLLGLFLVSSVIQLRNKGHPSVWPGAWKISPTSRKHTPPVSLTQNAWLSAAPRRIWKGCPFLELWQRLEHLRVLASNDPPVARMNTQSSHNTKDEELSQLGWRIHTKQPNSCLLFHVSALYLLPTVFLAQVKNESLGLHHSEVITSQLVLSK